jgi:hypothetical protein
MLNFLVHHVTSRVPKVKPFRWIHIKVFMKNLLPKARIGSALVVKLTILFYCVLRCREFEVLFCN